MSRLRDLFNKSVYIIREARFQFKNIGVMWAGGKDSTTMLYIIREAFLGEIPFKVIFLDTTFQFRETYEFIRTVRKLWGLDVIYAQNRDALAKGVSPFNTSRFECCTKLKTDNLLKTIKDYSFDALMFAIRHDEHPIRGKESWFSPRDSPDHIRIHPILHWEENDIWRFIREYDIPYNPLYDRVINGKKYRSLGCYPCTEPISDEEYEALGERGGRSQDKESEEIMERLRALGYM